MNQWSHHIECHCPRLAMGGGTAIPISGLRFPCGAVRTHASTRTLCRIGAGPFHRLGRPWPLPTSVYGLARGAGEVNDGVLCSVMPTSVSRNEGLRHWPPFLPVPGSAPSFGPPPPPAPIACPTPVAALAGTEHKPLPQLPSSLACQIGPVGEDLSVAHPSTLISGPSTHTCRCRAQNSSRPLHGPGPGPARFWPATVCGPMPRQRLGRW